MKNTFFPKKHLGQVFLKDQNAIDKIIAACRFTRDDTVLEIGPGAGALTQHIASLVKKLIAIETDRRLCEELRENINSDHFEIIHADILKYNFTSLANNLIVIGNLPYYISSPILTKLIEHRRHFSNIFITVQLEFGNRLIAQPNCRDYSALSCFAQYYSEPKMLFKIKSASFKPQPKVDSCFMRLSIPENQRFAPTDETLLFKIIHTTFQQRRKTIANALSSLADKTMSLSILQELNIKPTLRPENLTINDFIRITNGLSKIDKIT